MERRLGRGLSSLLSESNSPAGASEIEITRIRPNAQQPRRNFEPAALEELRDSIRTHGILQPVLLRPQGDGYELISGERRWRAARLAGLRTIPAIVRQDVTDREMLELALVENVQRQDLDPIERARGFRDLMAVLGLTQEQVADRVGLKRPTVANFVRLLDLPDAVQVAVSKGRLSMGHARALLGAPSAYLLTLAVETETKGLSVREVERRVREAGREQSAAVPVAETAVEIPAWLRDMQEKLKVQLGTKVQVRNGPQYRGQIVIDYYNRRDLDRLYGLLLPKQVV